MKTLLCLIVLAWSSAAAAQTPAFPLRKVTNIETSYPHWSPDSRQIVFQSDRNGNSDIYIADIDSSNLRRLVDNPAGDFTPVWSPDGRRIAFQSDRDGNEEIYLVNADGTGLRNLTRNPANDGHPKWAPDGATIIFNSNRGADSTDEEMYEIPVDGGDARLLVKLPGWDTYASIEPNGRRVLWRRVIAQPGFDGNLGLIERNSEIFIMGRDGTVVANISRNASFDGWPSWSADGTRVAFASNRSGRFQLYSMLPDGSDVRQLTNAPGSFTKPIWSPDGTKIVCTRTLDGNVEVFVLDLR